MKQSESIKLSKPLKNNGLDSKCGDGGNRTRVQTYSARAFYMFILTLIFELLPESNQPIITLAG